ncbi:rhomboid family intramembrane serine protease [Alistipes sp. OttesenSCG-928-L06]|nr:rhomboid family intramembrane serine protease [Alistipes sp. OttesenSCG-928-L06]
MNITLVIIVLTALVSILCFNSAELFGLLSLKPYRVIEHKEWWRVLTHAFVHGDYVHLLVNMIVLYSFGGYVEQYFKLLHSEGWIGSPVGAYLALYFGGMIAASVHDLVKNRKNPYWSSIGASGAVSAVVFASIFFQPWGKILLFGIIPIPGILFGILYLAYTQCSAKRGKDNINHYAHLYGALFGFVFPLILNPMLIYDFLEAFNF